MFEYNEVKNPIGKYLIWGGFITAILAPFVFIAFVSVTLNFNSDIPHPSDEELIQNFQSNEEDFNKLVNMSNENFETIRIAYDFTRLERNWAWPRPDSELGFSKERWNEYRALFDKLKVQSGLSRESSPEHSIIFLTTSSKGMTFRGSSKGYAYSKQELSPLFDSLNEDIIGTIRGAAKHGVAYKKIKENWFLSYDW